MVRRMNTKSLVPGSGNYRVCGYSEKTEDDILVIDEYNTDRTPLSWISRTSSCAVSKSILDNKRYPGGSYQLTLPLTPAVMAFFPS
jgi:hypothetical protein